MPLPQKGFPIIVLILAATVLSIVAPFTPGEAKVDTVKIVAFGTSLTAHGGWQPSLEKSLTVCLQKNVTVETIARSGATSAWALTALNRVVEARPDVVLVEFYVNDAALHRFVTVRQSTNNMDLLLSDLKRELPHTRIIVMAMNPVTGLRGMIRPFMENYIEAHRRLAHDHGSEFVDTRPAWLRKTPAELKAAIPDGAHPLPDIAAAVITPTLVSAIARDGCQSE